MERSGNGKQKALAATIWRQGKSRQIRIGRPYQASWQPFLRSKPTAHFGPPAVTWLMWLRLSFPTPLENLPGSGRTRIGAKFMPEEVAFMPARKTAVGGPV